MTRGLKWGAVILVPWTGIEGRKKNVENIAYGIAGKTGNILINCGEIGIIG